MSNSTETNGPPRTERQANSADAAPELAHREVRFEHSRNLPAVLERLNIALLVSTYQAGKIVAIGTHDQKLMQSFHNFERPMGVAVRSDAIAVAARDHIWILRNSPDVAPRLEPANLYSACYLARTAQMTGEIQAHEIAWSGDDLWVVNTLFSCLCTLDPHYSFVPRWRPPFISTLAAEDRCHLNGLAIVNGKPKYVTAMATSDEPGGWRPTKVTSGCLIDVDSGETVARGFAMPHSPRVYRGRVLLLDSGKGQLVRIDPDDGSVETIVELPGYTRGMSFFRNMACIGLSRIRETSTFGGVPIAEEREKLKCGVAVVDLESGRLAAMFEFKSGVEEIFDVGVLPNVRMPAIRGPFASKEGEAMVWVVPESARSAPSVDVNP